MTSSSQADFVVVGAGVFGVWIAHTLRQRGRSVILLDAYGAGNNRSSSGDESRIIRMGYGSDELYTRWAVRSRSLWQSLFRSTGQSLMIEAGVLWLSTGRDSYSQQTLITLGENRVPHEIIARKEFVARFPQIAADDVAFAIFEPGSGVLLARKAVQAVCDDAIKSGVQYEIEVIVPPKARGPHLDSVETSGGRRISGGTFIFACGAWLPKVFPDVLGDLLFPTRQEVFFFGTPPGARQFRPPALPVWLHLEDEMYCLPDIDNRGIKIACDRHGERFDPETGNRLASEAGQRQVTSYLERRFPQLKDAPLLETRVCQYENTSNGDFLVDRHPTMENAWLVGGGSGHGFKHGPAAGEYVAGRILNEVEPEPRFSLVRKQKVQHRAVY